MKLAEVPGVTRVPVDDVEQATEALVDLMARLRGHDAGKDPGLAVAALDAAELACSYRTALLAVVEHPDADPALLVAGIENVVRPLTGQSAAELRHYLPDVAGSGIREVTHATTETGHQVVITERIVVDAPPTGAQLQAVVLHAEKPRVAVFTLHSPTGRGWLEVAGVTGRLVARVDF